nr:hypothetical protein [Microbispora sp. GKU 823]
MTGTGSGALPETACDVYTTGIPGGSPPAMSGEVRTSAAALSSSTNASRSPGCAGSSGR